MYPSCSHLFVTQVSDHGLVGKPFSVSRLCTELRIVWTKSGLFKEYGHFTSTDNRKRFASVLYERFPDMREKIAKQLKHSTN